MESEDNVIILKPGESMHKYKAPKKKLEQKAKVYSKGELYALNREEQSKIIKGLTTEAIPSLEKDRVGMILKLQK